MTRPSSLGRQLFTAKSQVIDFVEKIVVNVVLKHAESKSGLHFVPSND